MKNKKSEQFNICTFCLCASCWESGLQLGYYHFKFIGLHLRREAFTNPFYNWLTFSKISKVLPELLFQLNFVYNLTSGEFIFGFCLFKNIRMHYQRFQLQLGYKQIKSVRFTFRSRDFPKTLLHLAYVLQNIKLEYKTPQLLHKAKQSQE